MHFRGVVTCWALGNEALSETISLVPSVHADAIDVYSRARGVSWVWLLAATIAILYGSLIPFDFSAVALARISPARLAHASLDHVRFDDLVLNLLIYVPIGAAFVVRGSPALATRIARVPWAIALGALLSLTAETLQLAESERVASWVDVLVNTLGTAAGAILGAGLYLFSARALGRLRRGWIERPFSTGALILTAGLVSYHLAPFDFVTQTEGLRESFRRARFDLRGFGLAASAASFDWWSMAQASGVFWFMVLGCVVALAKRESGREGFRAIALSVRDAATIIILIELMQTFTVSHGFDLSDLVSRCAAATCGAWLGICAVERTTRQALFCLTSSPSYHGDHGLVRAEGGSPILRKKQPSLSIRPESVPRIPTALLMSVALVQAAAVVVAPGTGRTGPIADSLTCVFSVAQLPPLAKGDKGGFPWPAYTSPNPSLVRRGAGLPTLNADSLTARAHWLPFEALWRLPTAVAVSSIMETLAGYAVLAAALAVLFTRTGIARAAWLACAAVAALAVLTEGLRLVAYNASVDVTRPLLAFIAAVLIARIHSLAKEALRAHNANLCAIPHTP